MYVYISSDVGVLEIIKKKNTTISGNYSKYAIMQSDSARYSLTL